MSTTATLAHSIVIDTMEPAWCPTGVPLKTFPDGKAARAWSRAEGIAA
jgi:hypothetical protein